MTPVIKTDDLGREPKHEWPRGCLRAAYRCPRNGSMDVNLSQEVCQTSLFPGLAPLGRCKYSHYQELLSNNS